MQGSPATRAAPRASLARARALALALALPATSVASTLLAPAEAEAQGTSASPQAADPAKVREATERYNRGAELLAKEQYAEALDALEQSYAIVPSPNSSLLIARCLRELHRPVDAVRRYELAEAEARERVQAGEPRYVPTAQSAVSEGAALRATLGTVSLRVVGAPEGTIVELGGAKTRLPSDGRLTLLSAPGEASIEVRPPSGAPVTRTATVAKGSEVAVEINLGSSDDGSSAGGETGPDGDGGPSRPWAMPAALVAGGVGLVGAGLFIGFGASSQATFDQLKRECGTNCGARRDEVDAGDRAQTIANTALVIGAVGLAASAAFTVLWLTDDGGKGPTSGASPRRFQLAIGAGHVRVGGEF